MFFFQLVCSGWLRLRVAALGAGEPPVIITENNIQFSNQSSLLPGSSLLHTHLDPLHSVHLINWSHSDCNLQLQVNVSDPPPLHSGQTKTTSSQKKPHWVFSYFRDLFSKLCKQAILVVLWYRYDRTSNSLYD